MSPGSNASPTAPAVGGLFPPQNQALGLDHSGFSPRVQQKVVYAGVNSVSFRQASRDLAELSDLGQGFERSTPLFYYVLKEAEVVEDGLRLGPVGGRIVAEVLIGVLRSDPESYLSVEPSWRPTLVTPGRERPTGQKRGGRSDFGMTDFLTFAGVDPASRGQ